MIETSHGAFVKVSEAGMAYTLWKAKRLRPGAKIGNFTFLKEDEGFIKIGCHTISIDEIEDFALRMKWSQQ